MVQKSTIINLLKLSDVTVIGTSATDEIKYKSDIDIMELNKYSRSANIYEKVLDMFRKKYKKAQKLKNVFITDFKCGKLAGGTPIRWDKKNIKDGYQYIEDQKINFVDCLQQNSIIKMDVIALINDKFIEFSDNYYFIFGSLRTSPIIDSNTEVAKSLLKDKKKYWNEKKYFKSLKRLYSFFKLIGDTKKEQILINFFNSSTGELYQYINLLNTIHDLIGNNFKRPLKKHILSNLKYIVNNIDQQYKALVQNIIKQKSVQKIKNAIPNVVKELNNNVNDQVITFLKNNPDLKITINSIKQSEKKSKPNVTHKNTN